MPAAPARPRLARHRELRQAWELLANLTKKEVKVRYKGSFLGIAWSLITPLLMTAIFTLVFSTFIRVPVAHFAAFFLAGFLIWQFHANSVQSSVGAIVSNGSLIKKVYFPREVLPLSLVLSQAFHLVIALAVVAPLFFYWRGNIAAELPALVPGIALLMAFTTGVSMLFAALNVSFRDLQELTQIIFMAWFYGTPIIYPFYLVQGAREEAVQQGPGLLASALPIIETLIQANPMYWFVRVFQRSMAGTPAPRPQDVPDPSAAPDAWPAAGALPPQWPDPQVWGICTAWAVGMLVLGWWLFRRRAVTFAKEV